ncbi:MAG: hypothetical protein M0P69_18695 [Bacteroidales bacterium]|nr:hypothetical protein [Bacteroidales bacterium]
MIERIISLIVAAYNRATCLRATVWNTGDPRMTLRAEISRVLSKMDRKDGLRTIEAITRELIAHAALTDRRTVEGVLGEWTFALIREGYFASQKVRVRPNHATVQLFGKPNGLTVDMRIR